MCSKCAKSLDVPSSAWKHQSLKLWALWSNKIKSRHLMVDVYWQFRTGAACMFSRTSHSMFFFSLRLVPVMDIRLLLFFLFW